MAPLLQFDNVSKVYRIGRRLPSLREALGGWLKPEPEKVHWAVKEVSFELQPGEALGIVGPNGAGKTTILKLLSNVTQPTSGRIKVNGRLSALIELGAGFHPDLTGRENIYLNGTILGLRKTEIKAQFERIVDFAGIGDYLDTPVKRYSSGMYARLGFAIAAHVGPQIFLVDEVLAVGDYAFQLKCYARMDELRANGTSLIFVSHNFEAIRRVCNRGLVMYRGEAIFQGTSADAVISYSNALRQAARGTHLALPEEDGLAQRVMTFDAEIENVKILDETGQPTSVFHTGASANVAVDVLFRRGVVKPIFSMTIRTPDGRLIYDTTTRWKGIDTPDFLPGERCRAEFSIKLPLLEGEYQLGVDVAASDFSQYYDRIEHAQGFWVKSQTGAQGLADLDAKVRFRKITI